MTAAGDLLRGAAGLAIGMTHDGRPVRSLTSAVLEHVRAEILSCRLRPGEKLLIAGLASRFGVSLSVIREALSRLAAEGLVKAEDQRGFRVSPVSIEDLQDITRLRIELEAMALRRAIEHGDSRWEQEIRDAYRKLSATPLPAPRDSGPSFEEWRTLHQRFHFALVAACRSEWLLRFRNALYDQSERYRFLSHNVRPRDVDGEHRTIFQATLDRDADAAVRALSDHLARTAEIIRESRLGFDVAGPTSAASTVPDALAVPPPT